MDSDKPTEANTENPLHWRRVAKETREKADAMDSPDLKERMLEVAAEYDRLAEQLERRRDVIRRKAEIE